MARLERRVREAEMPDAALRVVKREMKKIKDMERSQSLGPEHQKAVAYVGWMVDLPGYASVPRSLAHSLHPYIPLSLPVYTSLAPSLPVCCTHRCPHQKAMSNK